MMTGYLILADDRELKLPLLTEWKTCHTCGEPCDCFELRCPVDSEFIGLIHTAVRFRGEYEGKTVFYGIPDEMSFSYGSDGLEFFVSGRGMAALLIDNQPGEAEYASITLEELCKAYVKPYGIEYDLGGYGDTSSMMSITAAASCWKIITAFTKQLMAALPRFTKEGKMVLKTEISSPLVINSAAGAMLTLRRYGVISQMYINGLGYLYNQDALSRGIDCHKVVTSTEDAQYRMDEAAKGYFTLTVTLPKPFAAFPGDRVKLSCGMFDGLYAVDEAESSGGVAGSFCTLTLKEVE